MIRMSMMMMMMMRTLMMIKFYQLGGSVPNSLGRCSPLSRYFKLQTHHHQCLSPSSSSMILFNHHEDHSFHYSRRNSSIRDLNPAPSPFPARPEVSTTSEPVFLRWKLLRCWWFRRLPQFNFTQCVKPVNFSPVSILPKPTLLNCNLGRLGWGI